jgi:hypothetical protein
VCVSELDGAGNGRMEWEVVGALLPLLACSLLELQIECLSGRLLSCIGASCLGVCLLACCYVAVLLAVCQVGVMCAYLPEGLPSGQRSCRGVVLSPCLHLSVCKTRLSVCMTGFVVVMGCLYARLACPFARFCPYVRLQELPVCQCARLVLSPICLALSGRLSSVTVHLCMLVLHGKSCNPDTAWTACAVVTWVALTRQ